MMPDLDGITFLKTLKFQGIETPVIMFTGKGKEEIVIEALNSGATFYVQKGEDPRFQFAKLRRMIHEAAQRRQTEEVYKEYNLCVVVPAYNEEKLIGPTLESIPGYVTRIYAVDDASPDRTSEIIQDYATKDPRIVHIRHETNAGVGASIVTGYRRALEEGMEIAVVIAGDNQMDTSYLSSFLDPIIYRQADYTVGNRLLSPDFRVGMSGWRFFGNATLTLITKIASGYWQLMDPQNGYTAISRRALERIDLNAIYPRYGYCNDLLVRLNVAGLRVRNVSHPARYGDEKSGIRYRTYIFRLSGLLFMDFLWRMKTKYIILNFHPLVFFYLFGSVITLISILGGIFALYGKLVHGNSLFIPGILSLLLFIMGVMLILFAMLFDMEQERQTGWY
jgi:glycosyltransferase involved in cell wall biosynthesis